MRLLFINSGLKGIPEGYTRSIMDVLNNWPSLEVMEVWPQELTINTIKSYYPDLIMVFHGNLTPLDIIQYAHTRGILTFIWIVEDPYELDVHTSEWLHSYDYVFTTEIEALAYYNSHNVFYLPWGTNTEIYHPCSVPLKYRSDFCFVGMGFKNRAEILNAIAEEIKGLNVKLIGNWEKWGAELKPCLQDYVLPVHSRAEEVARFYAGARINLNIHRDPVDDINVNTPGIGAESLNNRTFDIAAAGGFQIVDDKRKELNKFYCPGKEIVVFRDPHDLANKIKYYLKDNTIRKEITANAFFKTVNYHTFKNRITRMFDIIKRGYDL